MDAAPGIVLEPVMNRRTSDRAKAAGDRASGSVNATGRSRAVTDERAHPVEALHRSVGNQAVQTLTRRGRLGPVDGARGRSIADAATAHPEPSPGGSSAGSPVVARSFDGALQRSADGRTSERREADGQATRSRSSGETLQTSLVVSAPGDEYEREAERVAEAMTRTSGPGRVSGPSAVSGRAAAPAAVQRMCTRCQERYREGKPLDCPDCERELEGAGPVQRRVDSGGAGETVDPGTEREIDALRGGGRPLPGPTRSYFESRFGTDFSGVRIHTGERADAIAREVNAEAFTIGADVAFRSGTYRPGRSDGRRLLAHELTHVVQQGGDRGMLQRSLWDSVKSGVESVREAGASAIDSATKAGGAAVEMIGGGLRRANQRLNPWADAPLDEEAFGQEPTGTYLLLQIACVRGWSTWNAKQSMMGFRLKSGLCDGLRSFDTREKTFDAVLSINARCSAETGYEGPPVLRRHIGCGTEGLGIAQRLDETYPGWRETIPTCPCTVEDAMRDPRFYDASHGDTEVYHPGAAWDMRSEPVASVPGTGHSQQCCYDDEGTLIPRGKGAGTPDVWAPVDGQGIVRHSLVDVTPWNHLGWSTYNRYWRPNEGDGCGDERDGTE